MRQEIQRHARPDIAMDKHTVPEDLRRFVLTSIPSVPFLEALLLMRANPAQCWAGTALARRLYVRDRVAETLLADMGAAGMTERCEAPGAPPAWRYRPQNDIMAARIDGLADLYSTHLVEVTLLIHSSIDRRAQKFADAFTWRKDS
jgi:hypothetical protein